MRLARSFRPGLVVLVLATLAGCARAPSPAAPPALVGAWRGSVRFSGGVLGPVQDLEFLYVFNAGGTMTESSNYDEVPPVPPAYGEWRRSGTDRFEAKYTFFTTSPPSRPDSLVGGGGWRPAGYGVLTEQIRMAPDGRSYESTIRLEMFDASGKPVMGDGEGTVHARRAGF